MNVSRLSPNSFSVFGYVTSHNPTSLVPVVPGSRFRGLTSWIRKLPVDEFIYHVYVAECLHSFVLRVLYHGAFHVRIPTYSKFYSFTL